MLSGARINQNAVQFCSDNAAAAKYAGRTLAQDSRINKYAVAHGCLAHAINLVLESFCAALPLACSALNTVHTAIWGSQPSTLRDQLALIGLSPSLFKFDSSRWFARVRLAVNVFDNVSIFLLRFIIILLFILLL